MHFLQQDRELRPEEIEGELTSLFTDVKKEMCFPAFCSIGCFLNLSVRAPGGVCGV